MGPKGAGISFEHLFSHTDLLDSKGVVLFSKKKDIRLKKCAIFRVINLIIIIYTIEFQAKIFSVTTYQSSLNANCVMRRLCFGSKYISATVDKLRISLLLFLMLLVKASFGTQKKIFGQVKLLYALLTKILR